MVDSASGEEKLCGDGTPSKGSQRSRSLVTDGYTQHDVTRTNELFKSQYGMRGSANSTAFADEEASRLTPPETAHIGYRQEYSVIGQAR